MDDKNDFVIVAQPSDSAEEQEEIASLVADLQLQGKESDTSTAEIIGVGQPPEASSIQATPGVPETELNPPVASKVATTDLDTLPPLLQPESSTVESQEEQMLLTEEPPQQQPFIITPEQPAPAQAQVQPQAQAQAEPQAQSQAELQAELQAEPQPQAQAEPEPQPQPQPQLQPQPQAEPQPRPQAEPQVQAQTKSQARLQTQAPAQEYLLKTIDWFDFVVGVEKVVKVITQNGE